MNRYDRIAQIIADLDDIDAYDRITFAAGFVPAGYLSNLLLQDKLLLELERLDKDAYICYLVDDREVLKKYYMKKEEADFS